MATVLQQQLATIAANSTHQLDLKAQKSRHSQSLLFEPRDAASQSFDTLYQICIEGFDELCQLDARFLPYERSIFAASSKNVDRTQMTKRENEELDGVVRSFLGLLQGRLLLKPAIKCLEWLVRRFRVQEHNTEALLLAVLPFYTTDMFAAVMSIVSDRLPPTFRWLHPYVASLQCPPRSAILSAISSNSAFFAAFNSWLIDVVKARNQSAILLGFWASIIAQAVNGMIDATASGRDAIRKQREEDLVLRILPVLQSTLIMKGIPELYLGACMVMTILVTKARLEDRVLDAMMEAVVGAWTEHTMDEGLACLSVIAEEKEALELSNPVARALSKDKQIAQRLTGLGQAQRVSKVAAGVVAGAVRLAIKSQDSEKLQVAEDVLMSALTTKEHNIQVLQKLITSLAGLKESDGNGELSRAVSRLLEQFAQTEQNVALVEQAARAAKVDLQSLRLPLLISTGEAVNDHESMDVDQPETKEARDDTQDNFHLVLSELPHLPDGVESFLDPSMPFDIFRQYTAAFESSSSSMRYKQQLFELSAFATADASDRTRVVSLLARVWTTRSVYAATRHFALQTCATELKGILSQTDGVATDGLLPYLLAALADENAKVRKAAAALCRSIGTTSPSNKEERAVFLAATRTYGVSKFEPPQLSDDDTHCFLVNHILPVLEDCVLDSAFITRALADILDDGTVGSATGASHGRKELKKALRADLSDLLAAHAVVTPVVPVQLTLFKVLNHVGKSALHARKVLLLPFARTWMTKTHEDVKAACDNDGVVMEDIESAVLGSMTHRNTDEVQFLKDVASGVAGSRASLVPLACVQLRQVFPLLHSMQAELADFLLHLAQGDDAIGDAPALALETLRALSLPTDVLVHLADNLPNANGLEDQPSSAKRRRHSRSEDNRPQIVDDGKIQAAVRHITLVLELVESSKPATHPLLLRPLFHALRELNHYKSMIGSDLAYLHQMLLGSLLSIVDGLNASQQPQSSAIDHADIRTDLIVECVRTTRSTQVHNIALLLVSSLAAWAPELVLHSVMPLFTFMSSTVLRQSDDYSAHVADETVSRIVPPLAASLKKKGKEVVRGAAELLLSFVAAFEHIPLHRRLALFELLVKTLGEQDVLFAVLAMLVERYASDTRIAGFVVELLNRFDAITRLRAMNQYLDLITDGLKTKRGLSDVLLGLNEKKAEQAQDSLEALLEGGSTLLQNRTLSKDLAADLANGDEESTNQIRTLYASLLEHAMQLTHALGANPDLKDPAESLLRATLGLLPTSDFIQSSAQLMQSGSDATRQQVFRSLESRAQQAHRGDTAAQTIFTNVLPNCAVYVRRDQSVATRHAAIACMDVISERFGKTDRGAVLAAADHIAGDAALRSDVVQLRVISLLAMASMVELLGDEAIGLLPPVLETAIAYLEHCLAQEVTDQQLMTAAFSLLSSIVGTLSWMLVGDKLDRVLKIASRAGTTDSVDAGDSITIHDFCILAAKKIAPAELFGAIDRSWTDVTLQAGIGHHSKATVTKNAQVLFAILLQAFDLRAEFADNGEHNVEEDTSLADTIAMEVTLKLNDATFRPFFMGLVDWSHATHDAYRGAYRLISVYHFWLTLSEQLKSLVTGYASFLLDSAGAILRQSSGATGPQQQLIKVVLQALSSSFRHDQDDFWQAPSHFDAVADPLLSQLEQTTNIEASSLVVSAVTDLASAASSPEHLKSINTKLMAFMKHADADVRLSTVKCERAVTERLGLEWLTLLPEMLPAISELLEDDDAAVERETLKWVREIEEVTGESLEGMLA
ncbi:snoRNA-binding rRNA-processing protein utp10 [Extremus antarcticus]|uniref:U3 small nucleolar RNA-associated protein 10 n=1 Tax=Extremus antarcticus TaxID=702011 RepID=A0AAJ0GHJ3_9PEZI|nr:snoRNA-binding rRNA-processing protein utp10 [Extremus antarcticus]